MCVLTATHYVVSCSVGPDPRNLRPFPSVFDTGSGPNLIRESALFDSWERYLVKNETVPRLGDASGRPLRLCGAVLIRARFGNSLYHIPFVVADSLAVDVIIDTRFMNQLVGFIECRRQCFKLHLGSVLPILARQTDGTFSRIRPVEKRAQGDTDESETRPKNHEGNTFNPAHNVRLTKIVTNPPMSQMAVHVVSTAVGLVYLEPEAAIQQRHCIRTANGVADIMPNEEFAITISNFAKTAKSLQKSTVVAYARRNLLVIHALPERASRTFESMLHLPFERTRDADDTDGTQPTQPKPSKDCPPDWRTTVNIDRIDDADLRKRVIEMLQTHQDMWTSGRLGEISATEHRVELESGTKAIRPMPYRHGRAMRDKAKEEIRKMLDAGVIEHATSEWASPIALVPKKDGSLRFCVDYRRLIAKTFAEAYPLPRIDD